jgi:hypothetical protein
VVLAVMVVLVVMGVPEEPVGVGVDFFNGGLQTLYYNVNV